MLPIDIGNIVAAIGALGAASQGLVDSTKIGKNGGLSNAGYQFINDTVAKFLPDQARYPIKEKDAVVNPEPSTPEGSTITTTSKLTDLSNVPVSPPRLGDLLHANWINGMKLTDQKAVAKAGIKLFLDESNAPVYTKILDLPPGLAELVPKLDGKTPLDAKQTNLLGQFDLKLTWLVDEAYQRADQTYRNQSKCWAMGVAVVLALIGATVVEWDFKTEILARAFVVGMIAAPLAPVSKDLASALQTAVKAMQLVRK